MQLLTFYSAQPYIILSNYKYISYEIIIDLSSPLRNIPLLYCRAPCSSIV